MAAKQTIKVKGKTHIKTSKNSSKTRTKSGKGNPNRCPACGRFM